MDLTTKSYQPLELYIVLNKSKVQFIDMILLVLIELLSKKVLEIEYFKMESGVEAGNIKVGVNYKSYSAMPIDQIFLHQFNQNANTIFNFQYILITAIVKASSKNKVLRLAVKSENLRKNLTNSAIFSIFNIVKLNKKGKQLSYQFEKELEVIKQRLDYLIRNDEPDRAEILNLIRDRIYFLDYDKIQEFISPNVTEVVKGYESEDYDINYELLLKYFERRLKLAHVEVLKTDHNLKLYEIERNGDGME